jgi:hypothetical protein
MERFLGGYNKRIQIKCLPRMNSACPKSIFGGEFGEVVIADGIEINGASPGERLSKGNGVVISIEGRYLKLRKSVRRKCYIYPRICTHKENWLIF